MKEEHKHQLAAEAAKQIGERIPYWNIARQRRAADIIQAAIEKGYCAGVDAMTQAGIEAVNESRAAAHAASEPIRHDCPNCGYSLTDHTHASEEKP